MRRTPLVVSLAAIASLLPAASAGAEVAHLVQPGETLWSIAAANNLTTRTVAAYNGLSEDGHVILGGTVNVPTVAEGAAALQTAGIVPSPAAAPAATVAPAATTAAPASGAPAPLGSYTVRRGDTLAGLAGNARVSVNQMAAMNGLDASGPLLAGTVIKLPTGSPQPANASKPAPAATVVPKASPVPTSTRVDCPQIQSVAAEHGVSGSLACAIGWQESGFNNGMVSPANARGVMQIMPGTWSWVQENLSQRPLDSNSARDNVRAGVLYLRQLLSETGGDEGSAVAGYYQGLGSVRSRGLYDDTQQYVNNVQALRSRFGG